MDWWNEALEVSRIESSAGGIIGEVLVEFGYKVYARGVSPTEAFFSAPAEKSRQNERAAVLAKAKAFATQHGAPAPRWSIQIRVFRDTAVIRGAPVMWKEDRCFVVSTFTDAAREVINSIRQAGILSLPWRGWARIGFIDDPHAVAQGEAGMTDQDAEGNPRFPRIAVVQEVFADENAACAAAGVDSSSAETADAPPGYERTEWKFVRDEIRKARESGVSLVEIAQAYAIPVPWVVRA